MNEHQQQEAMALVRRLIELIGDDPEREGLRETPKRVVKSWADLYSGYHTDPQTYVKVFEDGYDAIVALQGIDYFSTCEHHMLPFFGKAHIAYLPRVENGDSDHGKVLGVSKLARITNACARKLQIQERLTQEIADAVDAAVKPRAALVIVEGVHLCMVARGVNQQHATMRTSAVRGSWGTDHRGHAEALRLLGVGL